MSYKMAIQKLTTEKQPAAINASHIKDHLGTFIPYPSPITGLITSTYVSFAIPSLLHLSQSKRDEFAPMALPCACHNAFVYSEEVAVLNKSRNTVASINNVKGKTQFNARV